MNSWWNVGKGNRRGGKANKTFSAGDSFMVMDVPSPQCECKHSHQLNVQRWCECECSMCSTAWRRREEQGPLCFIHADYLSGSAALQGLRSNWILQHQQNILMA